MRIVRVLLVAVLFGSGGCATLQPVREPARFIAEAKPPVVYVTFKNRSKMTLAEPRVRGDSLFGLVPGVSAAVAAPLSHIERVEAMRRDGKRTTWLIAGLGAVTVGTVFAFTLSASGKEGHPCDRGTDECDYGTVP